jgi:hypothetical protein
METCLFVEALPSNGRLYFVLEICSLAGNAVSLSVSRSSSGNGFTRYVMFSLLSLF